MKLITIIIFTIAFSYTHANPINDILYSNKTLIDTNGDSKVDYWRSFNSKGDIIEVRKDLNYDQKIDYVLTIASNGQREVQKDTDYNGFFETSHLITYLRGNPKKEVITEDRNGDGKVDFKKVLAHQYRNKRTLIYQSIDKNYDGLFETKNITHIPLEAYYVSP